MPVLMTIRHNALRQGPVCRLWRAQRAFCLTEVLTALMILALITSSVVVVINRCADSAGDLTLHAQAFEVARQNMEQLLCGSSVSQNVEYGVSEKYPGIEWETAVESFSEPSSSKTWIRGVCSAEYIDTAGQVQTVELIHWLTFLTDAQLEKIQQEKEQKKELLAEEIIESIEEAAEYAGVDEDTVRQWLADGMLVTEDGEWLKPALDLYKQTGGQPSPIQQRDFQEAYDDLVPEKPQQQQSDPQPQDKMPRTPEEFWEWVMELFKQFQK